MSHIFRTKEVINMINANKISNNTRFFQPTVDFLPKYKAMNEYCKVENVNPLQEDFDATQRKIDEVEKKQEEIKLAEAQLKKSKNEVAIEIRELYSGYRLKKAFLKVRAEENPSLKLTLKNFLLKRRKVKTNEVESPTLDQ
jgi:hypothetical protein